MGLTNSKSIRPLPSHQSAFHPIAVYQKLNLHDAWLLPQIFFWFMYDFGNQIRKDFTSNSFCCRFLSGHKPRNALVACSWNFFSKCAHVSRHFWKQKRKLWSVVTTKLEDLKVLGRSPDLFNYVEISQGQLQLIIKHILFYHIWGLQPFWSSDLKQSNEYSIKQPSYIWETNVYIGMWQSKWVALDKRSQFSLTFGTYIKPLSHQVKHFSKVLWLQFKQS